MADDRQLAIPGTTELAPHNPAIDVLHRALEAWEMVRTGPFARSTKIAYERAYQRYAEWCQIASVREPLPVTGERLVAYLNWLRHQHAPSTVLQHAAAISSLDAWQRTTPENPRPVSVLQSTYYRRWLGAWQREDPAAFGARRKAPVFRRHDLERVLSVLDTPTPGAAVHAWSARAARDRALWLIGIAGALRSDNLAKLRAEDLTRVPEGLVVLIRSSKTDQIGAGRVIGIEPSAVHTLCPVRAWEGWLRERGEWSGPAFVAISRSGEVQRSLTTRSIQSILQRTASRAGVHVSSHSLRRVFASTTTHKRVPVDRIMAQAGWARFETLREYLDRADLWRDNPTRGLFEGDW